MSDTPKKQEKRAGGKVLPFYAQDSFEQYLTKTDFVSSTQLRRIARSPKHFLHTEEKETRDLKLGSLIHLAILEQDKFARQVKVLRQQDLPVPEKDFRTKANREYRDRLTSQAFEKGYQVVGEADYEVAGGLHDMMMKKLAYRKLLEKAEMIETSFYCVNNEYATPIQQKARPDALSLQSAFMADVKSCQDASPHAFGRDMAKYDSPVQACFHIDVVEQTVRDMAKARQIDKRYADFKIAQYFYVAAEKKPPYEIQIYRMKDEDMQSARLKYHNLMEELAGCMKEDRWPGYEKDADNSYGILDLDIPYYYFS